MKKMDELEELSILPTDQNTKKLHFVVEFFIMKLDLSFIHDMI